MTAASRWLGRVLAVAGAVGMAALALAPAASATPVTAPACASEPTTASWTSDYRDGRYELANVMLTGLDGCIGASLVVTIASTQQQLAQVEATVPTDALTVDVSDYRIPSQQVERIAVTLSASVPADPTTGSPGEVEDPDGSAAPGVESPDPGNRSLPSTGADVAWQVLAAVMLAFFGVLLRRRARNRKESRRG